MNRLFAEHKKRVVIDLCGAWKFRIDPDDIGENEGWYKSLPEGETVIVPSTWCNELGLLTYEGCGWYEKKFETNGGTLCLEFGSVMTKADIWLDGAKIGEHYGAFSQFEFVVNNVSEGLHTLTVRADNRIDKQSFPQRYTDWHNYGGVAREVSVHELKGISILRNRIVYTLSEDLANVALHAELELYNATDAECTSSLSVAVGEHTIYEGEVTLAAYEKTVFTTPEAEIENVDLWDIDTPNLYEVAIKTETDDLYDRVGFRLIETQNNDILLNKRPIEFRGVNRHEEHPEWGFAFPPKLMKKDIDLIVDLGCNTVRGSHYPQSRIFLDMLDERGILFWCEIPMWGVGFGEQALEDPVVVERGFNMHKEMTKYYYNHPSIIIWGMHNEVRTYLPCVYEFSKKFNEHLRRDGGNRLITHASNCAFGDLCMELDDIICINMYNGWYGNTLSDWDKFTVDFEKHIKEKGWYGKPVIMSEFGAGALAGFHAPFDNVRWSEEYQADLLEYCLKLFHKTDYMRGFYIWQFCNIRTSIAMDLNRVRYFNNKGILDEYRNPKTAYFKVRDLYREFAKEE